MTDPERAAFVEWFDKSCAFDAGHPLGMHHVCAELAAQAVEEAVRAERELFDGKYADSICWGDIEREELNAEPIPWRAAMGADVETAGVSESDQTIGVAGAGGQPRNPVVGGRTAEPPQPCHHSVPPCPYCNHRAIREAYADCERIAREQYKEFRESRSGRAACILITNDIAAKRKEVCGE